MTPRSVALTLAAAGLLLGAAPYALAQETGEAPPIYGQQLMTRQEQEQYRERLRALPTDEERAAFRTEHQKEMQERARERGVELPDVAAPKGPESRPQVRGREMMTEEERMMHREEMHSLPAEEREKARKEMHEEMKERAREQGMELPEEPMPRGGAGRGMGGGDPRGGGGR